MFWPFGIFASLVPHGLLHLLLWLAVRDAECPGCGGMLHRVRSRSTKDLHRCQLCEQLWARRGGVYVPHACPAGPPGPRAGHLR